MKISEVAYEDKDVLKGAYKTLSMDNLTWEFLESKIKPETINTIRHFLKPENAIYRGMKDTGTLIRGNGNDLRRQSANTANYYTLLLNLLPSWENMPRRDRSFICSTKTSSPYGILFNVIPLENQLVGICPENDIWVSFPMLKEYDLSMYGLASFNDELDTINKYLHKIGITPASIPEKTSREFGEYLKLIDDYFANYYDESDIEVPEVVEDFYEATRKYGVIRTLNKVFDPKANGFELKHANEITGYTKPTEMWMSGNVLFIRADMGKKLNEN